MSFDWHGRHFQIPGYLFLGAVLTSLSASGILERFGAPLIGANYRQQHFDADLRAGLMDVRRNSEQIAFYGGENAEQLRLSGYLTHIAMNWRSVVRYTWRVNFISEFYTGIATIPLWLMLVPKAMAHALSFGLYSQINSAYTQVRISLEWLIFNYADLATQRSVLQRLGEFERVVSQSPQSGIVSSVTETTSVQIRDLVLNLPDGKPIVQIGDLTMQGGERWLVRGPSGSGKSTFLRALAGLWRHGRGEVSFNIRQAMFLPQRSYVPSGTLREALSYPATSDHYDTASCQQALEAVNLAGYGHRLDETTDWGALLSPGEQQRLAVARALLFRPAILFLGEATSALDADNERRLYEALLFFLPHTTCISVAHHDALRVFHDREIVLGSGKAAFSLLEK
ncbi:ABC transporter ATP-binding protein/permease [Gluconobacter kondonii]|uniref:ABC transporter ATP-binding protein/permease n=1 Tax=Gluconobacter kondonii TaxID=941463 RepID=UPI0031FE5314